MSAPHRLSTGVPQGSVFALLLFAIYTTFLGPVVCVYDLLHHCYADDTCGAEEPPGFSTDLSLPLT